MNHLVKVEGKEVLDFGVLSVDWNQCMVTLADRPGTLKVSCRSHVMVDNAAHELMDLDRGVVAFSLHARVEVFGY